MKNAIILMFVFLIAGTNAFSQVSINTDGNQPAASSMLDVTSDNKGFLMPRMTFEQRNAIPAPAEGLMVFCTNCGTNGALSIFSDGAWRLLFPCFTPASTSAVNTILPGQIIWRWNLPAGVSGSKWNTSNNYETAMDMGSATARTETGIVCDTSYTRFVWSYDICGNSAPLILLQSTSTGPLIPTHYPMPPSFNHITWAWESVPGATGYKWSMTNDYESAIDMEITFSFTESDLSCATSYTRYVWAYNSCGYSEPLLMESTTLNCFYCGVPFTKVHLSSEGVAPVNKSVTYGTAMGISGLSTRSQCWLTSNLGASHQATAVDDATEASAGWYWKFNRKQGYKHDGMISPAWTDAGDYGTNNWQQENDPCHLELGSIWRVPTMVEWDNLQMWGSWTNWNGPFNSVLKIHAAGSIGSTGNLQGRGIEGRYWSSNADPYDIIVYGVLLYINNSAVFTDGGRKENGRSVRCILSMDSPPDVSTTAVTGINQTTATSGGNVTSNGGHNVIARGVCWSASTNPTITDSKTTDGSGTGSFTSNLTGLSINTLYYLRAYATNNVGTSYGEQVSFTTLPVVIGQNYGGGIVFYVDASGMHGLISATSDLGTNTKWGCNGTSIPGTSAAIGTGLANTTAIVGGCTTGTIAARLCYDLVQGSYSDWFLPSKDELNQMFLNKTAIGGFSTGSYWSSSEFNSGSAWIQSFTGGAQSSDSKGNGNSVRAIRSF
ncbi:MAG: hypothetical protein NTW16_17770 [Bacteroidetes bacterium]|nr:hypothetical protein [Bacteroidota bacterium]